MDNVYLEIEMPFGRTIHWHVNARDARAAVIDAADRMRCRVVGDGAAGRLVSMFTDTVRATYRIGIHQ